VLRPTSLSLSHLLCTICQLLTHRGEDSEWRQRFFRSLYTATNAQVYPGSDRLRQRAAAKQEDLFFTWMRRQQTYYRELLKVGGYKGGRVGGRGGGGAGDGNI
jgi:hypothetical protein